MNDLVNRLRGIYPNNHRVEPNGLELEAADRIEWDIQLDQSRCKRITELEQSLSDAMKRINQQYDIIQQRNQRIFELTKQLREILEVMPDLWTDERIATALGNARNSVGVDE